MIDERVKKIAALESHERLHVFGLLLEVYDTASGYRKAQRELVGGQGLRNAGVHLDAALEAAAERLF